VDAKIKGHSIFDEMNIESKEETLIDMIFREGETVDIDLSSRPLSPCNECLVASMCKTLCSAVTDYFFKHETYDAALERTLIHCTRDHIMDLFELRSHRNGIHKRWLIRTYRGRIQSFEQREESISTDSPDK
jgi:hypothetical protein